MSPLFAFPCASDSDDARLLYQDLVSLAVSPKGESPLRQLSSHARAINMRSSALRRVERLRGSSIRGMRDSTGGEIEEYRGSEVAIEVGS